MTQQPTTPDMADPAMGSERNRRQFTRVHDEVEVTLESDSTFYNGFTENISKGGLFVVIYDFRPLGDEIYLEFTIFGRSELVSIKGEVSRL